MSRMSNSLTNIVSTDDGNCCNVFQQLLTEIFQFVPTFVEIANILSTNDHAEFITV